MQVVAESAIINLSDQRNRHNILELKELSLKVDKEKLGTDNEDPSEHSSRPTVTIPTVACRYQIKLR